MYRLEWLRWVDVVMCMVLVVYGYFSGSVLTTFFIYCFNLTTICLEISISNSYDIKRWLIRLSNGQRFGVD